MSPRLILRCVFVMLLLAAAQEVRAAFNLQFTISPLAAFTAPQRALLLDSLAEAEALWEGVITGYQPGISLTGISVIVGSDAPGGLAQAGPSNATTQGGFRLTTQGVLQVNPSTIDRYTSWSGETGLLNPPPQYLGLNYLDDILAHEIGHILGIGSLWEFNGHYVNGSHQYTGPNGVAAYRREFDPLATFVPVEDAGSAADSHWNQRMRSSGEAGDPTNPWLLDPRVGITNAAGRDFAFELMTGALDPDYGEPFLSSTTIYSLRDLGFTTVPEPGAFTLGVVTAVLLLPRRSRVGL